MNQLLRLIVAGGLIAVGILVVAMGMTRHDAALRGPADLILLSLVLAVYLLPTALALYRDCKTTAWIILLNVLLGWTILGWFAALGWAAGGSVRPAAPTVHPAPPRPAPGH